MNRKNSFVVCLLLLFSIGVTAQSNQLLRCQVKTVACKTKDANGNWTVWRELEDVPGREGGNIVFDFARMSLYSNMKPTDNGKGLDKTVHVSRIIEIAHDTTFKEYGFYCIRFKCRDEKANLISYELLSLGFNNCHSLVLIATADKIISKQELEMQ